MKSLNRVHLYPHKEPNGIGYIVADRQGLRDLANKLMLAADSMVGLENITVYGSDGHPYELMIISDVSQEEWQAMPLPGDDASDPSKLNIVKLWYDLKK